MRVAVIGGGVAGATSAIALRRIGAEVTVYEAYADPAGSVGSFLSLATNGLRCLRALGCLEAVRAAGHDIEHQRLWSDTGRLLGAMPRGRLTGDPLHSVTLMRGRLVETLRAEAVRAGARIVTGERLVGASEGTGPGGGPDGGKVTAEFESGLTVEADLLVGADGIGSATRRILDPGAPEPAYAGLYTASGVVSGVETAPSTFNMIFGRNGAFAYVGLPGGETWWAAQVAEPAQPDLAAVDLDTLRHLYRHEEMARTVLSAATATQRPTLMYVLGEVPVWHGKRIVLVGDSGHPVGAGQGASMAIEDAVVLARALESADVPAALVAYDAERRERMAKMVKAASDNRDAKTAGPVARRVRNAVMPLATRLFYERATSWLYTHDVTDGWHPSAASLTRA